MNQHWKHKNKWCSPLLKASVAFCPQNSENVEFLHQVFLFIHDLRWSASTLFVLFVPFPILKRQKCIKTFFCVARFDWHKVKALSRHAYRPLIADACICYFFPSSFPITIVHFPLQVWSSLFLAHFKFVCYILNSLFLNKRSTNRGITMLRYWSWIIFSLFLIRQFPLLDLFRTPIKWLCWK